MITFVKTMGAWEYVVAYLVVFVLIQLAVYRYLRGRDDDAGVALASRPNADSGARGDSPDRIEQGERRARRRQVDRGEGSERRCPACGTANDPEGAYTFCRNCANRLPG